MKRMITLSLLLTVLSWCVQAQQNFAVDVQSNFYSPENLTISVGDTVTWTNLNGFHNVNGDQSVYPDNPESFSNGNASSSAWTYQYVFTIPGTYTYQCDPHAGLGMVGTVTVENAPAGNPALILTAVYDGPLPGGLPKGIEVYATADIADLSAYGVGSANNGGGSDGEEYTFPSVSASEGQYLYLTSGDDMAFQEFFGFAPDFADEGGSVNINGDDAIELFFEGNVIDVFGEINVDGTGTAWEYQDGWAYRVNGTGPDGSTFVIGNWSFSGPDALDDEATNTGAAVPVPVGTYNPGGTAMISANNDVVTTDFETGITIDILANDQTPNPLTSVELTTGANTNGTAVLNADNQVDYAPDAGFCGEATFDYEICDAEGCSSATVTVNVLCPVDYPEYPIGTVTTTDADGAADSLDVTCALRGVVHGVNLRPDGLQFTIIDEAGDGIGVFSGNQNFGYTVTEGDQVLVEGAIDQFNGLIQIEVENVTFISADNALQTPDIITALGEATESQLVTIENVTLVDPAAWGDGFSGFNVDVTDGTNTITVRIDNDVDLFDLPAPTGTFNVTGIGGQFDSSSPFDEGYQLLPRYMADIDPYDSGSGGSDFPPYSIGTVTTTDNDGVADSLGVACELQGIVYGVNLRGNGLQFTLIDAAGEGIGVFSASEDFGYTVTEGDELVVRGTIEQFNGLTQIGLEELEVVSTGNSLLDPNDVSALDETTESSLITLLGVTLVDPAAWDDSGASFNVEVTDGTNTFTVRIDNNTTLAGTANLGDALLSITGIGGQFDSDSPFDEGYQIIPRYLEDVQFIDNTVDQELGQQVKVFPNPAKGTVVVETTVDVEQVTLFNALGQPVQQLRNLYGAHTLNLNQLPAGLYNVVFRNGQHIWTEPLMVR
jgi:plastocyanin